MAIASPNCPVQALSIKGSGEFGTWVGKKGHGADRIVSTQGDRDVAPSPATRGCLPCHCKRVLWVMRRMEDRCPGWRGVGPAVCGSPEPLHSSRPCTARPASPAKGNGKRRFSNRFDAAQTIGLPDPFRSLRCFPEPDTPPPTSDQPGLPGVTFERDGTGNLSHLMPGTAKMGREAAPANIHYPTFSPLPRSGWTRAAAVPLINARTRHEAPSSQMAPLRSPESA